MYFEIESRLMVWSWGIDVLNVGFQCGMRHNRQFFYILLQDVWCKISIQKTQRTNNLTTFKRYLIEIYKK